MVMAADIVLGWEQIGWLGCPRHLTRPMLTSTLPVSTRQRSRMMVAAEVISLEYMTMMLAGCWWSSGVYKPRVCSGVATTLDWTGQREREAPWLS